MNGYWIAAVVSLWILLSVVAVAQVGLLRRVAPLLNGDKPHRHRDLLDGPGGIEVGGRPGEFRAITATGEPASLATLLGEPTVALLLSVGCQPCDRLLAELRAADHPPLPVRLVLLVDGHIDASGLPPDLTVLRHADGSAAVAFGTTGTPYAFALDETGTVRQRGLPQQVADLATLAAALTHRTRPGGRWPTANDRPSLDDGKVRPGRTP